GSTTHYFGNDHWRKHTLPMKSLNDARKIRNLILTAFEEAEKIEDPVKKEKLLTFTIIGGGPTGVELAGSLAEMCKHTMTKDFKNIKTKDAKVILIEKSKRILATYDSKLSKKAQQFLEKLGVQVLVDESVEDIKEGLVITSKTSISSSTIIWSAGIKPSDIGIKSNLATNKSGKILVNDNLLVKGTTNIFAGGDIAYIENNDMPLPAIAPVAMQEGIYIGKYIKALVEGKKLSKFKYKNKGLMATIGRNKAVAQVKKFKFAGFGAWLTWIFVHIYYLTGFKNKLVVLFGWAWSYITYKKGTRIILK
ncbi:MAG: FAD-dependent oxidoreductase, partial [Deferribacterota bacterium]|nr:FAD-dependent oxidoreductase [Deferribacterota bacterium]